MWKIMLIVLAIFLIADLYCFKGLWMMYISKNESLTVKIWISIAYWIISGTFYLLMLRLRFVDFTERDPQIIKNFFILGGIGFLIFMPKILFTGFHLAEDVSYLFAAGVKKLYFLFTPGEALEQVRLQRFTFISVIGIVVGSMAFVLIAWGISIGRFNYKVENISIPIKNLPAGLEGLKIVQISDIHIGSLTGNQNQLEKAVQIINNLEPDIICFTGDLVNNYAEELNGLLPILANLNAKYGKYSILGNHDYGEYYNWKDSTEKAENTKALNAAHAEMGFQLLNNESIRLVINQDSLEIIGVENWGFSKLTHRSDLGKALKNVANEHTKLLLSHNPSHWEAEVLEKTDIDLTLSGHTHGMQFGILWGKLRWSPSQYYYPRWAGLYTEKSQYLYVNRGLGFVGFPGRVGMPPEITKIVLVNKK